MANAVALDSNLLLLLTVGSFEPRTLRSFKRLSNFSLDDLRLVQNFVAGRELVVTPHLWTEVSNLAGSLPQAARRDFFDYLRSIIPGMTESFIAATKACEHHAFSPFGLTDTAICILAEYSSVVTEDGRLRDYMGRRGLNVIGLAELRDGRQRANASV